jgi:hypothetical protein
MKVAIELKILIIFQCLGYHIPILWRHNVLFIKITLQELEISQCTYKPFYVLCIL